MQEWQRQYWIFTRGLPRETGNQTTLNELLNFQ